MYVLLCEHNARYEVQYIYCSGRKHALRKRHTSRTTSVTPLQSISEESVQSPHFFGATDRSIRRILQPEKHFRDEHYKEHSANSKNVRVVAPPMLFNVELRRRRNRSYSDQCQPLTDCKARPIPRSLRVRGCRMAKLKAQFHGMQTQQRVLFRGLFVVTKYWGQCKLSSTTR